MTVSTIHSRSADETTRSPRVNLQCHATGMRPCYGAIRVFLLLALSGVAWGQVIINEIHYNPPDQGIEDGLFREFIELYNAGDAAVDLTGYFFDSGLTYAFPDGTVLGSGEYLVLVRDLEHRVWRSRPPRLLGPYEGRLDNGGERITLKNARGEIVETFKYNDTPPWPRGADGYDASLERVDPTAPEDDFHSWRSSVAAGGTPGAANSVVGIPPTPLVSAWQISPRHPMSSDAVHLQVTLDAAAPVASVFLNMDDGQQNPGGTTLFDYDTIWRFWKGTSAPSIGLEWTAPDFDAAHWRQAQGGLGYGDTDRVNLTLNDMRGSYATVFLRKAFTLDSISAQQHYFLDIFYDDGFICYVNGQEAARANAPETVTHNALATGSHESDSLVTFALPRNLFKPGENVMSVVGFNISLAGSSDFVLAPWLRVQQGDSSRIEMTETAVSGHASRYEAMLPPAPSQSVIRTNLTVQLEDGQEVTLPHAGEPVPFLSYFVYDGEIASTLPLLWIQEPQVSLLLDNGRAYGAAVALPLDAANPTLFDGARVIPSASQRKKIRFVKGAEFFGDRTINIIPEIPTGGTNAGVSSPYREHLGYGFYAEMGVPSPWAQFYRTIELPLKETSPQRQQLVFQQINERFLEMNGLDPDGDLYKLDRRANPRWEKHTNLAEGNASIDDLLAALNSSRSEAIATRFNLDNMLAYSAASIFTSNWDGYWQNHWMYLDPATGRWEMYPWDLDWIWGATPPANTGAMYAEMPLSFPIDGVAVGATKVSRQPGPVTSPMHRDAVYYEAYVERLAATFDTVFAEDLLFARIEEDQAQLLDDLALLHQQTGRDVERLVQQVEQSYATLKTYIVRRRAYLAPRLR